MGFFRFFIGFRVILIGKRRVESAQKIFLFFRKIAGNHDPYLNAVIAAAAASQMGDPLPFQTENSAVLGSRGDLETDISVQGGNLERIAESRLSESNFLIGVNIVVDPFKELMGTDGHADIEITEAHHNRKLDAPSGTALMLADSVISERPESHLVYGRAGQAKREKNERGIHALRMGSVVGEHTVYIATDTQILTLSHSAQSRSVFAEGALAAAEFIIGRAPGFYKMEDVLRG